jgi:predicted lipoprotein with Yx(FWY)xxD motif
MSARKIVVATATVLGVGLLGACSGYGGSGSGPGTPAPVAVQKQAAVDNTSNAVKLNVAQVTGVGQVVTDADGMTLYRFDKDTAKPPKSNCEGDCVAAWPPVLANGSVDVQGVDSKLIGTVTRSDGSQQVTINGWPLYRYAKDAARGEAKGQGVGSTWYAVTPTGGKANAAAAQGQNQAAPADAGTAINTANIDGLGTILTDQNGMTLYLYTKDDKNKHVSNCNGQCATTWPPLLANGDAKINGIDPKLVGKTRRADGTEQLTVGGWPVYRYMKDTAPGQATGHNVGGVWFTIETNGCKVDGSKKPTSSAGSDSSSGSAGITAGGSGGSGGY